MVPTITFDDVFKRCRLNNADKHKKLDARNSIIRFFEHLKAQNFIVDFEVKKRGNVIYGVTLSF